MTLFSVFAFITLIKELRTYMYITSNFISMNTIKKIFTSKIKIAILFKPPRCEVRMTMYIRFLWCQVLFSFETYSEKCYIFKLTNFIDSKIKNILT